MFTVGHGARTAEAFLAVLRDAGVTTLADVRRFPGSRRPGSRHTALRHAAFSGYADHMDTAEFRAAVDELVRRAARGERIAVMCAETVWWHCHRMLIADALAMRGATVVHLLDAGRRQPYRPHPNVRRGDDGWPVYDVPDTLPGL